MKKRVLALLLALTLCVSMLPVPAMAIVGLGDGSSESNAWSIGADDRDAVYAWVSEEENIEEPWMTPYTLHIDGTGAMMDFDWDHAPWYDDYCVRITSIVIGAGVTTIGNGAFMDCWELTGVTFAEGSQLETIGMNAFGFCNKLAGITIPAGVTEINDSAFEGCNNLTSIAFAGTMPPFISSGAFSYCDNLSAIYVPVGADSEAYAWAAGNMGLTSDAIFEVVQVWGPADVGGNLTAMLCPDGTLKIDGSGSMKDFEPGFAPWSAYCESGITSVVIGEEVNYIGMSAFAGCMALTSITIEREDDGFYLSYPPTVGFDAFRECWNLSAIYIPVGAEMMDYVMAFDYAGIYGDLYSMIQENTSAVDSGPWNVGVGGSDSVVATLDNGVLTISGIGAMMDFDVMLQRPPWPKSITSVVIGAGVTGIGDYAFQEYSNLASVTFAAGSQLESIGDSAFYGCGITSIEIPASVTTLGSYAFRDCVSLSSVTFAAGSRLASISDDAFDGSGLTSIQLPASVTTLGYRAFFWCSSLENVTFAAGSKLATIGAEAFRSCSSLKSVTIPASVTTLGKQVFQSCNSLTSITFEGETPPTTISSNVFYSCSKLNGSAGFVYVPYNTRTAYKTALKSKGLTDANLNNIIQELPPTTVDAGPWNIGKTTATDLVATLYEGGIFMITGTGAMQDFTWDGSATDAPWWSVKDSIASVIIKAGVTGIGDYAFRGCAGFESITFPSGVTDIGSGAFLGSGLTSVTFEGNTPPTVGSNAFSNCTTLNGTTGFIYVPAGTKNAYVSALNSAGLSGTVSDIVVAVVQTWGPADVGGNLTAALCEDGTLQITGTGAMKDDWDTWSNCPPWKNYRDDITSVIVEEGVTEVGGYAFYGYSNLASVTLPASVTALGNGAFEICSSLTAITVDSNNQYYSSSNGMLLNKDGSILLLCPAGKTAASVPATVVEIGNLAFLNCEGLTSVTFAAGSQLESIGERAFNWCGITSIEIPASVTSIGASAFSQCRSLANLTFAAGSQLESIGEYAFSGCEGLESVLIPASVTTIGEGAFDGCYSLESVTFAAGSKLESIGAYAFSNSGLTSIALPASVTSIGNNAFSCNSLASITVAAGNNNYSSDASGVLFNQDKTTLLLYPAGKSESSYTVPAGVTGIGELAFSGCGALESVTLPNGLTTIDKRAFSGIGLISVAIPASVTTIDESAFEYCSSLASVTFAAGSQLESIGGCAFCFTALTSITLPDGLTTIGSSAFSSCDALESITLPDGLTTIGSSAFSSCDALESVTLPASLTTIDGSAFSWCSNLTNVTFNGATPPTTIGSNVFKYSSKLDGTDGFIYVPEGSKTAYKTALTSKGLTNSNLDSIIQELAPVAIGGPWNIGKTNAADVVATLYEDGTLKVTGTGAMQDFAYDSGTSAYNTPWWSMKDSITSVVVETGVTTVGKYAFMQCSNLVSITLPASVTRIGYGPFARCSSLTAITVDSENEDYKDVDGVLFTKDGKTLLQYPDGKASSYTVPAGVTTIGEYAFEKCTNLTSITLPEGLTTIGNYAFRDCTNLTSIAIPASVTTIGQEAFSGCGNLENVTFAAGSRLTAIGDNAFYNCSNLTGVTFTGVTPPTTVGSNAFASCSKLDGTNGHIYVPYGKKAAYKTALTGKGLTDANLDSIIQELPLAIAGGPWNIGKTTATDVVATLYTDGTLKITGSGAMEDFFSEYSVSWRDMRGSITSVVVENGVTTIGDYAFYQCTNLTSVTLPAGVTAIGDYAFFTCNFESITLPESLTAIGTMAFRNCYTLESTTIPASVTTLGQEAFSGCDNLENVTFAAGSRLTAIGDKAFYNCRNLTSIALPEGLTTIGSNAFWNCYNLTSITLPANVTTIGDAAFCYCDALESIEIPASVTMLGEGAFSGCDNLEDVIFAADSQLTAIGDSAFWGCTSLANVTFTGVTPPTTIGSNAFSSYSKLDGTNGHIYVPAGTKAAYMTALTGKGLNEFRLDTIVQTLSSVSWNIGASTATNVAATLYADGTLTITGTGAMKTFSWRDDATNAPWWSARDSITSVVIENGVTTVGSHAFRGCTNLVSVTLPKTMNDLWDYAFAGCSSLTTVIFSAADKAPWMGGGVFQNCTKLDGTNGHVYVPVGSKDAYTFALRSKGLTDANLDSIIQEYSVRIGTATYMTLAAAFAAAESGDTVTPVVDLTETAVTVPAGVTLDLNGEVMTVDTLTVNGALANSGSLETALIIVPYGTKAAYKTALADKGLTAAALNTIVREHPSNVVAGGPWNIGTAGHEHDVVATLYADGFLEITGTGAMRNDFRVEKPIDGGGIQVTYSQPWISVSNSITAVGIGPGVTNIGDDTFRNEVFHHENIESVTILEGLTTIGSNAFTGCPALTSVKLPEGLTTLGDYAFYQCTNLASVTLPAGVTTIGDSAFNTCTKLTSIAIPASVTNIGDRAFTACSSLTAITVDSENENYKDIDGVLFTKDGKTLVQYPIGKTGSSYTVPAGVTTIGEVAFDDCTNLTSITLPEGLTTIGANAFRQCSSLTSVTFTGSTPPTTIGSYAFSSCTKLDGTNGHIYVPYGTKATYKTALTGKGLTDAKLDSIIQEYSVRIGSTPYLTLAEAFAAAKSGDTVTLMADVNVQNDMLMLPGENVKLDLAGHTLTAKGLVSFYGSSGVTDSAAGDGLLRLEDRSFIQINGDNGHYLPMYDAAAGGYRFLACSFETLDPTFSGGKLTMLFRPRVGAKYSSLLTDTEIGGYITKGGNTFNFILSDASVADYAAHYEEVGFYITFTGVDSVPTAIAATISDATVTLTEAMALAEGN